MTRRIINKKQKSLFKYYDFNGKLIQFHRENGYLFSDHKAMDDCVNHFLSQKDFCLKENKKIESKIEEPIEKTIEEPVKKKGFGKTKKER